MIQLNLGKLLSRHRTRDLGTLVEMVVHDQTGQQFVFSILPSLMVGAIRYRSSSKLQCRLSWHRDKESAVCST